MSQRTRLETLLRSNGIKPAHLAKESGYSRQHLLRICAGRMEPTRRCIAAIVAALRRMTRVPIRTVDLVDLGDDPFESGAIQ
jgi:predicted transcriptional regulator